MRRAIVVLLIATVCSLQLATGVAQAGKLKVRPTEQAETDKVTITGSTGCKKKAGLHVRALGQYVDGKFRRAIMTRKNLKIRRNGTFSLERRVRMTAVRNEPRTYKIVSHCKTAEGKRSGETLLRVLPFTGLPVLPQLLAGLGLVGSGAALLRFGQRTGASAGRRRRRRSKPLPLSQEKLIALRAPKAD